MLELRRESNNVQDLNIFRRYFICRAINIDFNVLWEYQYLCWYNILQILNLDMQHTSHEMFCKICYDCLELFVIIVLNFFQSTSTISLWLFWNFFNLDRLVSFHICFFVLRIVAFSFLTSWKSSFNNTWSIRVSNLIYQNFCIAYK